MFGAKRSLCKLLAQVDEAVARANELLAKDPNDPKAKKILALADHTTECLAAATFGRRR